MALTREQILASRTSRKPQRLEVPEWGGDVFLRALTVKDQREIADEREPDETDGTYALRALLHSLVDEQGNRILQCGDVGLLEDEDGRIVQRLLEEFNRLNGSVEEAVAGFEPAPSEARSTA